MTPTPVLRAEGLTKVFGSGRAQVRAVDGVDITLERGELVLIMGPSGSGKTTLLSMLGALLRPTSGDILLDGVLLGGLAESELSMQRAHKVGFVFQSFQLLEALTVEQNVLFPATLVSGGAAAARGRARALLERLGMSHRASFLPHMLSGGEKQRVAIARALINDPPLILADEPTGNLDSHRGQEVLMILHDIARDEGRTVLVVTHDPRVEDIADRILWLEDGQIRDRRAEVHDWARDPVCGMQVDGWSAELRREHAGRPYVFCSPRCVERFEAEPDRYAPTTLAEVSP